MSSQHQDDEDIEEAALQWNLKHGVEWPYGSRPGETPRERQLLAWNQQVRALSLKVGV